MTDNKKFVYDEMVKLNDGKSKEVGPELASKLRSLNSLDLNWILIKACEEEKLLVIEYLHRISKKVTNELPELSRTAIHVAARKDQLSIFNKLCDMYSNKVNYKDVQGDGLTHFQAACQMGHEMLAETLLRVGIYDDLSCVLRALVKYRSNARVLRLLLSSGAHLDVVDDTGTTPLSSFCRRFAVMSNFTEEDKLSCLDIIRCFITHKIDVNAVDIEGVSPIQNLYYHGIIAPELQLDVLKVLIKAGANPRHSNRLGETLLHYVLRRHYIAVYHGNSFDLPRRFPEVNSVLLELDRVHGLDVNARDSGGQTPLSCAVSVCNLDAVKTLLTMGADPHSVTFDGRFLNPLNEFLRNLEMTQNMLEIIKILQQRKFKMTNLHKLKVLRFLMGFPTSQPHFPTAYVLNLASNLSAIVSHCNSYATNNDEMGKVQIFSDLKTHLKIITLGKMYLNEKVKTYIVESVLNYDCYEASNENISQLQKETMKIRDHLLTLCEPLIVREIDRARNTMIKKSVSLLDVCTCSPDKAYKLLEDSCWQSLLNNEAFPRNFKYIGPTIKGYVTKALARQYYDEVGPKVATLMLEHEYF